MFKFRFRPMKTQFVTRPSPTTHKDKQKQTTLTILLLRHVKYMSKNFFVLSINHQMRGHWASIIFADFRDMLRTWHLSDKDLRTVL